jgi:energy-converting hydrogenase A subunit M
MRALNLDLAAERLETEERLAEAEHRAQERASLAAHHRAQEQAVARLVDSWDSLDFSRRRSMLRDVVDRIVVKDDGVKVLLRP